MVWGLRLTGYIERLNVEKKNEKNEEINRRDFKKRRKGHVEQVTRGYNTDGSRIGSDQRHQLS